MKEKKNLKIYYHLTSRLINLRNPLKVYHQKN